MEMFVSDELFSPLVIFTEELAESERFEAWGAENFTEGFMEMLFPSSLKVNLAVPEES